MKQITRNLKSGILLCLMFYSCIMYAQKNNLYKQDYLKILAKNHPDIGYTILTKSAGGEEVPLIKIGKFNKGMPSVFVAANMEGTHQISTDAAIWFVEYLSKHPQAYETKNWYILPCGNIDAHLRAFDKLKTGSTYNKTSINDDKDDQVNEDGPEDLNGDGVITQMIVKHPMGQYIKDPKDPRIIRKANLAKGEKGIYKLYEEGFDNDKDGLINEDPDGGVNIDRNFTYMYEPFKKGHGVWNGSEPEAFALMRFFAENKDIAMSIVLGKTNNMLFPPKSRKGGGIGRIKVPAYYGRMIGIDTQKMYGSDELKKVLNEKISDKSQARRIYMRLVNSKKPTIYQQEDLPIFAAVSKEFKSFLKEKDFNTNRLEDSKWANGSFEKFCYFQYGLPTFSLNVWNLPLPEKKGKDKQKQTPGKNKDVDAKQKKILAYIDKMELDEFVNWTKVNHPDFKEVEVGGLKPYALTYPHNIKTGQLFEQQLPYLTKLSDKLPKLKMSLKIHSKNKQIKEVIVYVENTGQFPYPTYMGERNGRPAPVILQYVGKPKLLSGNVRTRISSISPNQTLEFKFLINAENTDTIKFNILSENIFVENKTVSVQL